MCSIIANNRLGHVELTKWTLVVEENAILHRLCPVAGRTQSNWFKRIAGIRVHFQECLDPEFPSTRHTMSSWASRPTSNSNRLFPRLMRAVSCDLRPTSYHSRFYCLPLPVYFKEVGKSKQLRISVCIGESERLGPRTQAKITAPFDSLRPKQKAYMCGSVEWVSWDTLMKPINILDTRENNTNSFTYAQLSLKAKR